MSKVKDQISKPDIYYIVPDRYTNEEQLKFWFGYDNSEFISFLQEEGFIVDSNAYANYPNTATSISSTLSANYHSDLSNKFSSSQKTTYIPYFDTARHSPVISSLKSLGYTSHHLGVFYEVSNQSAVSDHDYMKESQLTILNKTFTINNFPKKELIKSLYRGIFKRTLKVGGLTIVSFKDMSEPEWTKYQINKIKEIASQPNSPKIVFAHILSPHDPFYFNEDGSLSKHPLLDDNGMSRKDKYVTQVKFVNNQMKELIREIKDRSDNKAVIILQADEGTYADHFGTEPEIQTPEVKRLKYGVLAAYHIPDAKEEDIYSGANNVNIFRLIFNSYLGANLPYLPNCSYSYEKDNLFKFFNVTEQLTGKKNPECPEDGIFQ